MTNKLYVVFGATGNTGKRVIPLLLAAGHSVRVFARSPGKLQISHDRLQVVQGDVGDAEAVRSAIKGAQAVISLVGGPLGDKSFHGGVLPPFIKAVHAGMLAHGVKRLLVQTGAASVVRGEKFNFLKHVLVRQIDGRKRGDHGCHVDNDEAIRYLETSAGDIEWMVTRPPLILAKPSEGKRVVALDVIPWPPVVTFEDLAAYTVSMVDDDKAVKTSRYCGYPLTSAIHPPSVAGYVASTVAIGLAYLMYRLI
ncbi:MAG: putative NADH-flavin reductase [Patiriisocius sp.]|jgi:putative NADH-flavin reductase